MLRSDDTIVILPVSPDGSVTLYLQHENPGPEKEANWLPAPTGRFIPMLRLFWPTETPPSIVDGSWRIPAISKAPERNERTVPDAGRGGAHDRFRHLLDPALRFGLVASAVRAACRVRRAVRAAGAATGPTSDGDRTRT